MGTITIRNLPDDLIKRLKGSAEAHGQSMEQEVRDLLEQHYASKSAILERIRQRWGALPETQPQEVEDWRDEGRP